MRHSVIAAGDGELTTHRDGTRADIWRGLVGSILVCLGGFAVADIPRNHPGLAGLGLDAVTYGHGKTLVGTIFWLGVALMIFSWVRIGRRVGPRVAPADRPSATTIRWAVIGWAAPLLVSVPLFSRDVYAYLGQASVFGAGFDPYADGPAHHPGPLVDSMAQVWASTTAPYGPMFMAIARGVVEITGEHVYLGVIATRVVLLPGLALSLWAVGRLADHFGAGAQAGLWLALLNPMVLIHLVGGPHVELLMMGLLAAGVALVVDGRHVAGLTVLGLAVSVKITAGVAIPFMLWIWLAHIRSQRTLTARDVTSTLAAVVAVPVAVFAAWTAALGLGLGWLTGLGWADRIINWFTLPTAAAHLVTLVAAPFTSLSLWPVLTVTRAIGAVCLAPILVALWWRGRRDERSAMTALAWAMLAVLVLEPSTLPWYYTWVLVIAAAFTLPEWTRALVVAVSAFMLIVFQPDDSIVFYKLPEVVLAVALSALAAISLIRPDPLRLRALARRAWGA
ncbi:polyprenol phosphomannose-dependent alpha 1,6 mannosyltransferase MptB [Gordonia sp. VNQ95]|uniref:polyprenol phosphomannose-dependent alpha 1,6 mannosyltransferase MptB n=1 Tax=Gordonia TaxID=2053 RepID=UPI0032B37B4E